MEAVIKTKELDAATLAQRLAAAEEALRASVQAKEELQSRVQEQIRELELLRAQLAERAALLQATNKSMETLCYSIAHDLRAPNRSMQGFAELLLTEHARTLDATGHEYLRRIAAAAARNDCLILDMLAYGRLSHVALPCSLQSLESCLQTVLQNVAAEIQRKGTVIRLKSPLPPVYANPTALEAALSNLLSNALKFTARGVPPQVTISAEEGPEAVRVRVQDNGVGIPLEHRDKIFNIFERLHSGDAYPGTGMGLAIVQKAVERMGGRVGLDSDPGHGSCFWIELARAKVDESLNR